MDHCYTVIDANTVDNDKQIGELSALASLFNNKDAQDIKNKLASAEKNINILENRCDQLETRCQQLENIIGTLLTEGKYL